MNINGLKYFLLAGITAVSLLANSQPPYKIEKVISKNKIVDFNNQKLLIIDFWATWCTPCAPATKQLEILQKSMPDDLFIVSVSDENIETISSYIQKNPIQLAVLKDDPTNSMIDLFQVKRRPYAILLTLDGSILYKGHPSEITTSRIEKYLAKIKTKPEKNWDDLFVTVQNSNSQITSSPDNKKFFIAKQSQQEKRMYFDNGTFYYSGPLSGLVKYLANCSVFQIILNGIDDFGVSMHCSESEYFKSKSTLLQLIDSRLSLNLHTETKSMEAYVLDVVNSKLLWDDKQLNWSDGSNPSYIVGTDRIEADNLTLKEIANLLSDVKGDLYYYKGNDGNCYDWSFHYRYNDLMKEDLENNFGIILKKEKINLPIYILSPQ